MAEAGLQAPDISAPPLPPAQLNPTQQVQQPTQPTQQGQQIVHLNWSHFKPEFSGKPEDAEAHLLRTSNWMNTITFGKLSKLKDFCLTLMRGYIMV